MSSRILGLGARLPMLGLAFGLALALIPVAARPCAGAPEAEAGSPGHCPPDLPVCGCSLATLQQVMAFDRTAASTAAPAVTTEATSQASGVAGVAGAGPAETPQDGTEVALILDDGHLVTGGRTATLEIVRSFYADHPDAYDTLVILVSSAYPGDVETDTSFPFFSIPVRNDVQGIGLEVHDSAQALGLPTARLCNVVNLNDLPEFPDDPVAGMPSYGGLITPAALCAHEVAHRFLAYASLPDKPVLGRAGSHWSFYLHTDASVLEGCRWSEDAPGSFLSEAVFQGFGPLDLYLLGLTSPQATPATFLIADPQGAYNPGAAGFPLPGVRLSGEAVGVSAADLVNAHGPRVPAADAAPHTWTVAFALVVPPGTAPPPEDLAKLDALRLATAAFWEAATGGRGYLETSLDPFPPAMSAAAFETPAGTPTGRVDLSRGGVLLRVADTNRDDDYGRAQTIVATVESSDGDMEVAGLLETATRGGEFRGGLPLQWATPVPGNGVLEASPGASLTLVYTDPTDPADRAEATAVVVRVTPVPALQDHVLWLLAACMGGLLWKRRR